MANDELLTERRGDVLVLTLNRPERLNAAPPSGSFFIARTSCGTSTALKTPPASRM